MDRANFYNAFYFTEYRYEHYHHTDARDGASRHFIGMLEEGRCRIVSEHVTIEAGPGEPFYIPLDLPYQSYWYSEGTVRLRSYGFDFFPETQNAAFRLQKFPESFAPMVRAIPLTHHPDSAALGALFTALSAMLPILEADEAQPRCRTLERAKEYMRLHPDCRVTNVARHCGVSESALYACFKRHGNMTPNEVRQEIQIKEAIRLLTTTDLPVQEISDRLGFSSAAYFRKILATHTGMPPRQIRKNAAKV